MPIAQWQRHWQTGASVSFTTRYARFGVFDLDLQKRELFKDGSRIRMQSKVAQALLTLLERQGELVTREELRLHLWPSEGRINYDANVNTTVNKLRFVLGDSTDQPTYIETIPRLGYSFIAKVEYSDNLPPRAGASAATVADSAAGEPSAKLPRWKAFLLRVAPASTWFTAGVIVLVIAGMILGAAIVLFSVRFA
jgi:DNA-binding winged helix-turn-helix (wHTH) protein